MATEINTEQQLKEISRKLDLVISMLAGTSERQQFDVDDLDALKKQQKEKTMAIVRARKAVKAALEKK